MRGEATSSMNTIAEQHVAMQEYLPLTISYNVHGGHSERDVCYWCFVTDNIEFCWKTLMNGCILSESTCHNCMNEE